MGRALFWIACAIAVAVCLFGLYYMWVSLKLMMAGKPTGATLTFALYAMPWLFACACIVFVSLVLRRLLTRKK